MPDSLLVVQPAQALVARTARIRRRDRSSSVRVIKGAICGAAAQVLFALCITPAAGAAEQKPVMADPYLDLTVTYAVYAKNALWHKADVGGYWGEVGIAEKNSNGAVRGMANTMLGYALLAKAWKEEWLAPAQRDELTSAGLDRVTLVSYVRENLAHLAAHHTSAEPRRTPVWGDHWQSSLWLSAAGFAAFLIWDDLTPELRDALARMSRHEANRIAAIPPHDYKPGNTAAEENAWDTLAPALALALQPQHPDAEKWWKALKAYSVNTYSVPADRTSTATVGTDLIREIVTTTNAFADFTLDNHGFFHPDYVQVSGQHLGESWLLLALGDRLHGTSRAAQYIPYGMHHVEDVWTNVTSRLLQPSGEFLFPSGNDWTYHCSMNQSYLAYVATALNDPVAQIAEQRAIRQALDRRKVSPPGRILGDSNLDWWWEPLFIKRCTTALLHHLLRPSPAVTSETEALMDQGNWARLLPDSNVWIYRNGRYLASASWGKRRMGAFLPVARSGENPYQTLPLDDGILPNEVKQLSERSDSGVVLDLADGRKCAVVCLPNSVVWLSPIPLRGLGIENHPLAGPSRTVHSESGSTSVRAMERHDAFVTSGSWVNVDDQHGHICSAGAFQYRPAGGFNRRSAALDRLTPVGGTWQVWQMVPQATAAQTAKLAADFVVREQNGRLEVTLRDGGEGGRYRLVGELGGAKTPHSGPQASGPAPLQRVTIQELKR